MEYKTIQGVLEEHLHQDFDAQFASLADAVLAAVKSADYDSLQTELRELSQQDDDTIKRVLDTHAVQLWNHVTPRAFLNLLQALADLI